MKSSTRKKGTKKGKSLANRAIELAVIAHIRHEETDYDELLLKGYERWDARDSIEAKVSGILNLWEQKS